MDAGSRLTQMTLKGMTPPPAAQRIDFQYDWQRRPAPSASVPCKP